MTLLVHPDPQEAAGGYAFLELPDGALPGDSAHVAVFDAYGERWLAASEAAGARVGIGDPRWQSERFDFGPYPVYRHEGADWVRIGPEIVNKIEEYAPLKIAVGGSSYDVTWPDDVPPRAGAAVLGGVQPVARAVQAERDTRLVGRIEPVGVEAPAPELPDEDTIVPPPPRPQAKVTPVRRGGLPWLLVLVLLALVAAGAAAWWYWPREAETAGLVAPAPVIEATSSAPVDACTPSALRGLTGGFVAVDAALRDCGAEVSPDTALELVEKYAAQEDGRALFLFGTLYDGKVLDARIENLIGLTFPANDARAAEYYARAVKAGTAEAETALQATCTRLQGTNSTLAKGAYDDFCG